MNWVYCAWCGRTVDGGGTDSEERRSVWARWDDLFEVFFLMARCCQSVIRIHRPLRPGNRHSQIPRPLLIPANLPSSRFKNHIQLVRLEPPPVHNQFPPARRP